MSRKNVIGIIVLILVVVLVVWLVNRKKNNSQTATPVLSVTALNKTKNVNATDKEATPGDEIVYTLNAENHTDKVMSGYVIEANIGDLASIVSLGDAQGASFNSATNSLVWTPLDIPANGAVAKQFTVKVNPLPTGTNNDVLKISFNNELDIQVIRQQTATNQRKGVISGTGIVKKAPKTGASTDLIWILALGSTIVFGAYKFFGQKTEIKA